MKKLKAFTLIEMIIVIVIIGILAAALIPKLNSARGRANDVARKADLSQVMAGLISHQIDKGSFPDACGELSLISGDLLSAGLDDISTDPANATLNFFGTSEALTAGQYGYCAITRNTQPGAGVVVMSIAETEGGANYVVCDTDDKIGESTEFSTVKSQQCTSFEPGTTCQQGSDGDGECLYDETKGQLRYIYMQ